MTSKTIQTSLRLSEAADRIRSLHKKTVDNMVLIGSELLAEKEVIQHGDFQSWIDREFCMTPRTAQRAA